MKKSIILTLALFLIQSVNAQDFQFHMYFEDANGNKDTLILGYDANGTALIDSSFGEENIIGMALDSIFEVRMSDEHVGFHTFQTKKQILPDSCSAGWRFPFVTIGIHCKNWKCIHLHVSRGMVGWLRRAK